MNVRILFSIVIFFSFFIIATPLYLYLSTFGKLGISDRQDVWGQFGDFMNVWVTIASLMLISTITYFIHERENERTAAETLAASLRQREVDELEKINNRPSIIFSVDPNRRRWVMKNIGKGAAFNIKFSSSIGNDIWDLPLVKMYSLGPGETFIIDRVLQADVLAAVYYDIHNNVISSLCRDDVTDVHIDQDSFINFDQSHFRRLEDYITNNQAVSSPAIGRPVPTPTPRNRQTPFPTPTPSKNKA